MSEEKPVARGPVKPATLLPALLAAAAAAWVFRGAAAYGFAQDDFAALARAAGVLPRFDGPWRWLSLQGFFDLMRPLAALDPLPYHLVSLAGHALATGLVYRMLARFTGRPAAFAGAVLFGTHAAAFTAVYWISTVGDLYALVFALLALESAARGRAAIATLAFTLSLLCKESLVLLPAVVASWRALDGPRAAGARRPRIVDPALAAMALVAAAYLAYFVVQNGLHATPAPGAEPYAIRAGRHVLENAATYLGWTANPWLPTVRGFSDAIDPPVFGWGFALAAAWLGGAFVPALRARGWLHAAVMYAAFIAPVLPLERHTYHYYLYGALAAAALGLAALLDAALGWLGATPAPRGPVGRPRPPAAHAAARVIGWTLAVLLAAAFTLNGTLMVRKIETMPFGHPDLRAEPIVDRARIAANVRRALEASPPPPGATLLFYSPAARALAPATAPERETYWERNVRSALYDGVAVRLFAPGVREVRFVTRPEPGDSLWYALYDVAGRTRILPPGAPR